MTRITKVNRQRRSTPEVTRVKNIRSETSDMIEKNNMNDKREQSDMLDTRVIGVNKPK